MAWFRNKDRPPEVWEEACDQPFGDIEAAQKIREICASAADIAGTMTASGGRKAVQNKAAALERYQAAVKRALEITREISDDSMRDISVSQIITLSVNAGHLKTARVLLRAVRSQKTQSELIAANPALRDQDAAS